jgi:tight adherence protein C
VTVVAVIGLLFLAVAVGLWLVAALEPRLRRAERLGVIDLYGYTGQRDQQAADPPGVLASFAGLLGEFLASRLTSLREAEVHRKLIAAGMYNVGARAWLGYRVILGITIPLFFIWLFAVAGASAATIVIFALIGAVIGIAGPSAYLRQRTRSRLERVDYAVPELIDLLVVILEAGVAFTAGMQMAAQRLGGPLGDELRLTVQEQSLGLSTMDALQNWLARCDTPAVGSFVRAMVQGERLGVSTGQILRNLAVEMRLRRRQAAEERAHKAGVKILFPLAFLIFPAMFVVILGPALYRIIDQLSTHHH